MAEDVTAHSSPLGVWHNIIHAGTSINELPVAFKNSFIKTIGDGDTTSFWLEHWIGNDKLCKLYPRLFRLEESQSVSIKERIRKDDNSISLMWSWTHPPSGRTEAELQSLISLLMAFNFNNGKSDTWNWVLDPNGMYTAKKMSTLIDEQLLCSFASLHVSMRNPLVPKKVEIFIWRLLNKRLPVRLELDKRGIDLHSVRCPLCDGDLESVDHAILKCNLAFDVWSRFHKWWGINNFSSTNLTELLCLNNSSSTTSFGGLVLQASKWVCAYLIWKNRNNKVFHGKTWNAPLALNEIQETSFLWISTRAKKKNIEWLSWISSPEKLINIS
ncbi:uncharacterized protein [Rutidosis leptorrhynchoides]|uniref:uncharacterized protein n=1 Tax=Rutidosis leptorrhynchoides TaxID=125765 RepID=UPI003A98E1F6